VVRGGNKCSATFKVILKSAYLRGNVLNIEKKRFKERRGRQERGGGGGSRKHTLFKKTDI
jgi:hypothetical protein